ncbi:restriction endonuclease [Methyloglobulus sp.]|uniref:restriction endonuclease n=1 Tax=Methyloglobulus sp. TaxID=2518622 RepID=UPI00398A3D47
MARRKDGVLDDLLGIAKMLPWWSDVGIALITYFWLHNVASNEVALAVQPGKMGEFLGSQMSKTFATIGQYLLPFVFSLGAVLSFFDRKKREHLLSETKQRGKQNVLLDMSWREFEMLVGEVFRQRGFTVVEIGGNGPDGGVDLVLKKNGETHLVQCKQWKAYKVGVEVVRELYGVMAAKGAVSGYVVTSGVYTNEAKAFANGRNIELIDGSKLTQMIQGVKLSNPITTNIVNVAKNEVTCPKCGSAMVKRNARRGANNAGQAFFGCS